MGFLFVFWDIRDIRKDAMIMKKILAMLMVATLLFSSISLPAMAATNPTVETGVATYSLGKQYFSNLTVSGDGIRTILISFSENVTSGDKINLPGTPAHFAVSSSSNFYNRRINIDAGVSTSDIQNYLRGVGYTVVSPTQTVSITVTTESITSDTYYNSDTQHYYQYIPDTSSYWTTAYTAAQNMSYMGRTGYLATITSKAEDTFLNDISGGKTGWLGGTILANSGTKVNASGVPTVNGQYYSSMDTTSVNDGWYWACGPEIGNVFYTINTLLEPGFGANSSGAATADAENTSTYYNWARGTVSYEPNNETNTSGILSTSMNYETCLTTLKIDNNTGKQGTLFSWNDKQYTTAGTGTWDAKGYFVEYGDKSIGDNGSGSVTFGTDSGVLKAGPTLTSGDVLRSSDTAGTIEFTSDRPGAYYYTVVADGADAPTIDTSGAGTSCNAGENVITNPVGLTAGAKDIYIKAKDTAGIVSDAIKLDIPVPSDVELTDASWLTSTTYTCSVELSSSAKLITLSVNSGYFTIPSLGSGTLTFLGGTNDASYINTYTSGTQQFESAILSFTNIDAAESLLGGIVYHTTASDSQTITASASTVSPLSGDVYFNGHFYRYVSGNIDWPSAVLAAGNTEDPYFGGRGYIATATNQAEHSILLKLTDTGGGGSDHWYDAWMGGLWQRNTGSVATPNIIRGTDGSEITYNHLLSATTAQKTALLQDYTRYFSDFDTNDNSTYINANTGTVKYYWIDGPEAGQEIAYNADGFSPWHSGEPNGGDFVYIGWEGAYWDDLSAYSGDNIASGYAQLSGYVLEFSGFGSGSTAGITKDDTKTVAIVDHTTPPVDITPYEGTYDGSAHDAVTLSGTISGDVVTYSTNGTDFSSTCPKNTGVGSQTVYVKIQRNGYTPWTSEGQTSVISSKPITFNLVTTISPAEYTGLPFVPLPEVTFGSITLVKDVDYTVGYSNNTDIGIATVTITGKGNYSGTASKNFAIYKKNAGVDNGEAQGLQITADGLENLYNDSEIYTDEDRRIEEIGGQISIELSAQLINGITGDRTLIEKLAQNKTIALILDLSLFKTVSPFGETSEEPIKINHISGLLTLVIPIPDNVKGKTGIALYRVHGSVASMIPIGEINAIDGEYCTIDGENVTLHVRNFSTYAVAYDSALTGMGDNETNPDTRDYTTTVPLVVLGFCSLLIAILYGKKRKAI